MGSVEAMGTPASAASNPFSTKFIRPGAIDFIFGSVDQPRELVATFLRNGLRGQIIGPHGSGKSSFLLALRPYLAEIAELHWTQVPPRSPRDWLRISSWLGRELVWPQERRRQPVPDVRDSKPLVWVIDGFDSLSWFTQRSIQRYCRRHEIGLFVTAHRDLGLPTLYRPTMDMAGFRALATNLLPSSATLADAEIRAAFQKHSPNIREALFELYDSFERQFINRNPE